MPSLVRGEASSCTNQVLDLFTSVNGVLTDIYSLEFQIFEKVTNPSSPVQVYPVSGRQTVDIGTACPTGDKISTGHYVAKWTSSLSDLLGTYEIRWFFKQSATYPEQSFSEEFLLVSEVTGTSPNGYCTVQDLRDEGVPSTGTGAKTDAQVLAAIIRATKLIDRCTKRWFEPRSLTMVLDGSGARELLLDIPIISVSKIRLISEDFITATSEEVDLASVRVYNRHLTGMISPDDRENPRIGWQVYDKRFERPNQTEIESIFNPQRWPDGSQNVEVTGVFGYTDPNGTTTGETPELIRRACVLMTFRDLQTLSSIDDRFDARNSWRLTELRTRDQTIKLADPSRLGAVGVGAFTGDPEVDRILLEYIKPISLGAA